MHGGTTPPARVRFTYQLRAVAPGRVVDDLVVDEGHGQGVVVLDHPLGALAVDGRLVLVGQDKGLEPT